MTEEETLWQDVVGEISRAMLGQPQTDVEIALHGALRGTRLADDYDNIRVVADNISKGIEQP